MSNLRLVVLLLLSISFSKTGAACTCAIVIPGEADRMIRARD